MPTVFDATSMLSSFKVGSSGVSRRRVIISQASSVHVRLLSHALMKWLPYLDLRSSVPSRHVC
jgi:hypothetical protein